MQREVAHHFCMAMQSEMVHARRAVPSQRGGPAAVDDDAPEIVCVYCGRPLPISGYWGFDVCDDAPDGAHATTIYV
jgi:hypothetical protein